MLITKKANLERKSMHEKHNFEKRLLKKHLISENLKINILWKQLTSSPGQFPNIVHPMHFGFPQIQLQQPPQALQRPHQASQKLHQPDSGT